MTKKQEIPAGVDPCECRGSNDRNGREWQVL